MDNASDNWFALDVVGDASSVRDAAAKDKQCSQDLERLVFGDNFSSRLKVPNLIAVSERKKSQSKYDAPKPISITSIFGLYIIGEVKA